MSYTSYTDSLYNFSNERREKAAIWKLLRSPFAADLCNDTFKWFAVGIPLNLLDKRQPEGDIDLLAAMLVFSGWKNDNPDFKTVYRSFEVKTSKISRAGEIKSLKENKFYKYKKQMEKLRDFGANQIFLLEAYIIQAGYSDRNKIMPQKIYEVGNRKLQIIAGQEYGYTMFFLEQLKGSDEQKTGVYIQPINIHPAQELLMKEPFKNLVEYLDKFPSNNDITPSKNSGYTVITYCSVCKNLVRIGHRGPYICTKCNHSFI